jgi:hypothetical protein
MQTQLTWPLWMLQPCSKLPIMLQAHALPHVHCKLAPGSNRWLVTQPQFCGGPRRIAHHQYSGLVGVFPTSRVWSESGPQVLFFFQPSSRPPTFTQAQSVFDSLGDCFAPESTVGETNMMISIRGSHRGVTMRTLAAALLVASAAAQNSPTEAPTAPTSPTTAAPTTGAPTTAAPTTGAPTTAAPTTAAPTFAPSQAPTTGSPTQAPPTRNPTPTPTRLPTRAPTRPPTHAPVRAPTRSPTPSSPTPDHAAACEVTRGRCYRDTSCSECVRMSNDRTQALKCARDNALFVSLVNSCNYTACPQLGRIRDEGPGELRLCRLGDGCVSLGVTWMAVALACSIRRPTVCTAICSSVQ